MQNERAALPQGGWNRFSALECGSDPAYSASNCQCLPGRYSHFSAHTGLDFLSSLWVQRPSTYAVMQPETCEAKYITAKARPEDRDLHRHLEGERTIAVPLIGADDLAVAGGLDVDEGGEGALLAALDAAQRAGLTAWAITSTNDQHDGGWVWFLYTTAVTPERIRAQLIALAVVAGVRADIFPTRQAARLPFGVHTWTGRRGVLLLQDGRRFDLDTNELEAGIAAVLALSRNPAPPNIEAPPVPKQPPRRQPEVHAGADAIGRFCAATDLVDLLTSYPGYSVVARSGQGGTLRCGCPGHKHGDRRPSLEVKHGRDGRQVAVGYAPGCIWHNQRGRNDAFNVYCELERLTPREAVKRLAGPLPARPYSFPPHPAENTSEPSGPDRANLQARSREAKRKRVERREAAQQVRAGVEQRLVTDQALSKRGRTVLDPVPQAMLASDEVSTPQVSASPKGDGARPDAHHHDFANTIKIERLRGYGARQDAQKPNFLRGGKASTSQVVAHTRGLGAHPDAHRCDFALAPCLQC